MVDVGGKALTARAATASGRVRLGPQAFALVAANQVRKGDVLTVAQLAGADHAAPGYPGCALGFPGCALGLMVSAAQRADAEGGSS